MAQIVVFVFSVTLTLTFDLCSIFFVTRIAHDIMGYLVAMEIRVTLYLLVQFCICYIL